MRYVLAAFVAVLGSVSAHAQGFCNAQAESAASSIAAINSPKSKVQGSVSKFQGYSGPHQKLYSVTVLNTANETSYIEVKMFEFENPDGYPCSIDQITIIK